MQPSHRLLLLATAAFAIGTPASALAQSSPAPALSPAPSATNSGMTGTPSTPAPEQSSMPSTMSTGAPASGGSSGGSTTGAPSGGTASAAPRTSLPGTRTTNVPGDLPDGAKVKAIKTASLTRSQVLYGLTHQVAAAKQLAQMKSINFDNLRVYRLPTSLKTMFHVSDAESQALVVAMLGQGIEVAQTTPALPSSNGNNSPIQYLRDVLANINVSNALNNLNVLNNSNVNVNVALKNVLNNNKISIGQVVGLYIGGGGIITTITK